MKYVAVAFAVASLIATAAGAQDAPPAPKKFPTFTQTDTDKDGFVTQAEWDASGRSPKRLAKVDADKDGKVTRVELHEATVAAREAREAQSKP